MAKQVIQKEVAEIKKELEKDNVFIGSETTIKNLKLDKVAKVFLTKNCNEEVKKEIEQYSDISGAEIVELDFPNDELGIVCKKPFSISVLSVKKA